MYPPKEHTGANSYPLHLHTKGGLCGLKCLLSHGPLYANIISLALRVHSLRYVTESFPQTGK